MKRKILLLILIVVALFSCYIFSPDINNLINRKQFDTSTWKNWQETEVTECLRWDMAHNLIKKHKIIGLNVDEIIDLLGKPEQSSKESLIYYLGMARQGIDTGSLILTLNNGVVTGFKIIHG